MIQVDNGNPRKYESDFGLLHVLHEHQDVKVQINSDLTRPADSDLAPQDQEKLKKEFIRGKITLTNPSNSNVILSNIHIQMDIDEKERTRDFDIALVEPNTGTLDVNPNVLKPGREVVCNYAWNITSVFGQIGGDFDVVFSIRPSYTVTMLELIEVAGGNKRDKSQDIGEAKVIVSL